MLFQHNISKCIMQYCFFSLLCSFLFAKTAIAAALTDAEIPDKQLRLAFEVIVGHPSVTEQELALLTGAIDLSDKGISDLKGLEYLTSVTEINLSNNNITVFSKNYLAGVPKVVNLLGNYGMVSLTDNAFGGCEQIKELLLPNTVKRLGKECFMQATNLRRIVAKGVTDIEAFCFFECKSLEEIELPVTERIQQAAFGECVSLSEITLLSLKTAGASAFTRCTSLQSAELGAEEVGDYCFQGASLLVVVKAPNIKSIGSRAFERCDALRNIITNYPCKIDKVGNLAFPINKPSVCIQFEQDELTAPTIRVPDLTDSLVAASGQANWGLVTLSDPNNMSWDVGSRNLSLNDTGSQYRGTLSVPSTGMITYRFVFTVWPEGAERQVNRALISDSAPDYLQDLKPDAVEQPQTSDARQSVRMYSILLAIFVVYSFVSLRKEKIKPN